MPRLLPVSLITLLAACGPGEQPDDSAAVVDYRLDPATVTAPPVGGEQWMGPDVTVPAYSEKQYCQFGTYTGPTVGLDMFESFQSEGGHHLILLGTTATTRDHPDGEVIDCTATGDIPMTDFEPLINAEPTGAGSSFIDLPEHMAVKLNNGQRYVVQAHYVNTSDAPRRHQDLMNLGLVPEDTVQTWAAAFALTVIDLHLPPNQETTTTFDCTFDQPYNLLYLTGHMHEWGKTWRLDKVVAEQPTELFTLDPWDPQFRDAPPLQKYAESEFSVLAGEILRTQCTWDNTEDEVLEFPSEMCATYGMLYPSTVPVVCQPW